MKRVSSLNINMQVTFLDLENVKAIKYVYLGSLGLSLASRIVGPPLGMAYIVARHVGNDMLKEAYEENLRLVLEHVSDLISKLRGRIVITAEHGELLGEYGAYGHFKGTRVPQLVEVPWLTIER